MKYLFLVLAICLVSVTCKAFTPINEIHTILKINKEDPEKLIQYYHQRVIRGESMSTMAKLYSEDPGSAQNGGLYQGIVKGVMVPEFEAVAFSLKPGEISEVFKTQYGYHFIQLVSGKGDTIDLRHLLIAFK